MDDLDTIFKFDRTASLKVSASELGQAKKTRFAISPKVRLFLQILV
jgi:hypothetical protein